MAVHHLCFYAAIHRLPLGVAVTLEFLGPLAVALASSRRASDLAWATLAGLGVTATAGVTLAGRIDLLGVLLALAAGATWAVYILVFPRLSAQLGRANGLAVASLAGALVAVPFGVAVNGERLAHPYVVLLRSCRPPRRRHRLQPASRSPQPAHRSAVQHSHQHGARRGGSVRSDLLRPEDHRLAMGWYRRRHRCFKSLPLANAPGGHHRSHDALPSAGAGAANSAKAARHRGPGSRRHLVADGDGVFVEDVSPPPAAMNQAPVKEARRGMVQGGPQFSLDGPAIDGPANLAMKGSRTVGSQ